MNICPPSQGLGVIEDNEIFDNAMEESYFINIKVSSEIAFDQKLQVYCKKQMQQLTHNLKFEMTVNSG